MLNLSVLPNAIIIYYTPNAATAFDAWRDVGLHCLYGVKISLLKAFESFQMVLMKFFNLLNALKVRFKTA